MKLAGLPRVIAQALNDLAATPSDAAATLRAAGHAQSSYGKRNAGTVVAQKRRRSRHEREGKDGD